MGFHLCCTNSANSAHCRNYCGQHIAGLDVACVLRTRRLGFGTRQSLCRAGVSSFEADHLCPRSYAVGVPLVVLMTD